MRQRDSVGALLRPLGEVVGEVRVVFLQVTQDVSCGLCSKLEGGTSSITSTSINLG